MAKECPENTSKAKNDEVNFVFMNNVPDPQQKALVFETLRKGVLDSGCTRTVAG